MLHRKGYCTSKELGDVHKSINSWIVAGVQVDRLQL